MKKLYSRIPALLLTLAVGVLFTSTAFGTATIVIQNNDQAGSGFNDPTPVAPVGGNSGTTLGQQRLNAFEFAANIWGATLTSGPTITVNASWPTTFPCSSSAGTLGSAGAISTSRNFPGAPFTNTVYSVALANALANTDLNGSTAEISAQFNANLGTPGCLESLHWYYGFDTNAGVGGVNLVTVLLHEFAHGLGMQTFTNRATGAQSSGFPSIYDRFLFDSSANKTWPQMTDTERVASAINTDNLVWNGPFVVSDVPNVLSAAGSPSLRVNSPPAIAGNYQVGTAVFGASLNSPGVTAGVVQAIPADACSALTNAAEIAGKIALIDRGSCDFVVKVKNAQNAGAVGVIIVNNVSGTPPLMGGTDPTITIPSVSVTNVTGDSIKAQLAAGVNATLLLDVSTRAGADSSGRPRLYTPNPLEGGSSVSHWDTSLFPNQLMEPNISSDLSHSVVTPEDLTFSLFKDIGWCPSCAQPSPTPTPSPTPSPSPTASPSPSPTGPANNSFANAQLISGCSGTVNGTNVGANKETNEPNHSPDGDSGGGSVWYQWQAPSTGDVTLTTLGSNYDTVLAVYTGNSVGALSPLGKNDDVDTDGGIFTSTVTFSGTAGTVYKIAVDGWGEDIQGARGNIVLNWTQSNCPAGPPSTGCAPVNQLQDPGFEASTATVPITNQFWPSTSTNFGSSLCSDAVCGVGGTAAPRSGTYWIWFGGTNGPESGTVSQSVTIPSGAVASLNYYLRIGRVTAPFTDVLNVKVDGTVVQTITEPATAGASYTLRSVSLNAFANGGQHTILFEYISPSGGGIADFNIDDVTLDLSCQPVVLTAQQIAELKAWTVGGRTSVYVKPQFPDSSYRVIDWGQVVRSGNDFTVDANVQRVPGPFIQAEVTTAQIYDLGPLADGIFNFNFKTSGTLAKSLQFTVSSAVQPPNPIDDARTFVKWQYRDFLNREADQGGEDFWTDNIEKCMDPARRPPGQTVEQCTLRQRETTSGAFFLSPEFQYTGYFVYRMYQGALGRQPKLSEFTPDALTVGNGIVVNGQLSGAKINQNKAEFAATFVNCVDATKSRCAEFKAIYDALNNQQYVDKLFQTTGVNASAADRAALVDGLNANPQTETRASVLQKVVDGINVISEGNQQFTTTYGQAFYNAELNRAFVQLEYFGYMRRDPDEGGYAFWLAKLNQFGGDFIAAEMVLAFISSPEYRARFGQP